MRKMYLRLQLLLEKLLQNHQLQTMTGINHGNLHSWKYEFHTNVHSLQTCFSTQMKEYKVECKKGEHRSFLVKLEKIKKSKTLIQLPVFECYIENIYVLSTKIILKHVAFQHRPVSSAGQSVVLITRRSRVRSPYGPRIVLSVQHLAPKSGMSLVHKRSSNYSSTLCLNEHFLSKLSISCKLEKRVYFQSTDI